MNASVQHKGRLILLIVLLSGVTSLVTYWFSTRIGFWVASDVGTDAQNTAASDGLEAAAVSSLANSGTMSSESISTTASMNQRIVELEAALAQEQSGRLMLQRALADQEQQLDKLAAMISARTDDNVHTGDAIAESQGDPQIDEAGRGRLVRQGLGTGAGFRTPTTAAALVDAGVDESVALELIARQDSRALAELELRDQAAREGWLEAEDFAERLEAGLPEQVNLRDALEPAQWDQYLYTSGRSNRVAITGVLNGSAAYNALLQTGDQLLSYAGEPIYRIGDLQSGTRGGTKGEQVLVRVLRGDDVLELTVPRGPLGVNLSPERVDPTESGVTP